MNSVPAGPSPNPLPEGEGFREIGGSYGAPRLVLPLPAHRFDEVRLAEYLAANLPGFAGPLVVRQFQGGQSNPTYHLHTPSAEYVLRKKPPGTLLPSAHAVDREYAVQSALAGSAVPVAPMRLLCRDDGVIGTMFYVMDHVPGRVFADRTLAGVAPAERAAMYDEMNRVMAALHGVDWQAAGLTGFGRPQAYIARQIDRWTRQYVAADTGNLPEMERLMAWLPVHTPAEDETAIAHGDFRLGNLIFHPERAAGCWRCWIGNCPRSGTRWRIWPIIASRGGYRWTMEGLVGADMRQASRPRPSMWSRTAVGRGGRGCRNWISSSCSRCSGGRRLRREFTGERWTGMPRMHGR